MVHGSPDCLLNAASARYGHTAGPGVLHGQAGGVTQDAEEYKPLQILRRGHAPAPELDWTIDRRALAELLLLNLHRRERG